MVFELYIYDYDIACMMQKVAHFQKIAWTPYLHTIGVMCSFPCSVMYLFDTAQDAPYIVGE